MVEYQASPLVCDVVHVLEEALQMQVAVVVCVRDDTALAFVMPAELDNDSAKLLFGAVASAAQNGAKSL